MLVATGVGAIAGAVLIGAGVGGIVGIVGTATYQGVNNGWDNINWGQVAVGGLVGAAAGAAIVGLAVAAPAVGAALGKTAFTIAVPKFVGGGAMAMSTVAVSWGTVALGAAAAGVLIVFAGKVTPPSWVNRDMIDRSQTPVENADRIMNDRYGKGKWRRGPNNEHNIIRKFVEWIMKYR